MKLPLILTLLPYLLLAASLVLVLVLFLDLSRRLQLLRSRVGESTARFQADATEVTNGMASLRLRIEEIDMDPGTAASIAANGMNSTVRAKVLKMHRLGQPVDTIADTLQLPKGEVDLLVKVHQIVMRPYQEAGGNLSQVG